MSEEGLALLSEIFLAVFELPEGTDVRGLAQGTTTQWDSLGHVTLVTAIESEFGVEITTADSIEITSFEAAVEILDELLNE